MRRSLALLLAASIAASAWPAERSRAVRAEFQRHTPCPSTGAKRGACPGYQADHIQPLCAGGRDAADNLQWLTLHDHQIKTKRDVAACFGRVHRP